MSTWAYQHCRWCNVASCMPCVSIETSWCMQSRMDGMDTHTCNLHKANQAHQGQITWNSDLSTPVPSPCLIPNTGYTESMVKFICLHSQEHEHVYLVHFKVYIARHVSAIMTRPTKAHQGKITWNKWSKHTRTLTTSIPNTGYNESMVKYLCLLRIMSTLYT